MHRRLMDCDVDVNMKFLLFLIAPLGFQAELAILTEHQDVS
jgi:hypothetical protein